MIFVLILGCSSAEQSVVEIQQRTVSVDRGDTADLFIGITNPYDQPQKYTVRFYCTSINCSSALHLQSFPVFELQGETAGAFPVRIIATQEAPLRPHTVVLEITDQDAVLISKKEVQVYVTDTAEAQKQKLYQLFDGVFPSNKA